MTTTAPERIEVDYLIETAFSLGRGRRGDGWRAVVRHLRCRCPARRPNSRRASAALRSRSLEVIEQRSTGRRCRGAAQSTRRRPRPGRAGELVLAH